VWIAIPAAAARPLPPPPVRREYKPPVRPNRAPFPPRFRWFADPPLTRYWVRPRAESVEVLLRWLSVGQAPGLRRMGADSGGSHTPSSELCRRLHSLLIVPEKLQQRGGRPPLESVSPSRDSTARPLTTSMMSSSGCQGTVVDGKRHSQRLLGNTRPLTNHPVYLCSSL